MTRCHHWEGCRAAAPSECAPDEGGNQHALRDAIRDAISTFRMRASSSSLIGFAPFTISFASFLCSSCQIRTTLAQSRRCSQAIRHSQAIRQSVELVAAHQMSRISYSELTGNQAISGARRGAPDESYLVLRAPPSRPEAPAAAAPVGRGEGAVVSTCMHTRGPSWRSTQHTAMLAMVVPCRSATSLSSPRSSWKSAQLPHLMREEISMQSETQSGRSS